MPVVEVRDVVKRYDDVEALRGVSFEVEEGEIFGLLGPNGAGKSTLMSIIAGALPPTSGEVLVFGRPPSDPSVKARIGLCAEHPPLYEGLTGLENLVFFAKLYGLPGSEAKRRALELLKELGLGEAARRLVRGYSSGMRKRLGLAVALIHDPDLIILDEPTTGLDPNIRREIWERILRLRERGKTILLATHYMEEAERLCDRVAIIDRGKILALDTPENLKRLLGPLSTITFKVEDPEAKAREILSKLPGAEAIYEAEGGLLRLLTKDPDTLLPEAVGALTKAKVRVLEVRVSRPTLEDVFVKLTGRRLR